MNEEEREAVPRIAIRRICDPPLHEDGFRLLVDRIWSLGISMKDAAIDHWADDFAPSTALRTRFSHDPTRWNELQKRYRRELKHQVSELRRLSAECRPRPMTFSTKDMEHDQAVALRAVLIRM